MATVTIDSTSQRFTSDPQPEPDIALLHTTEVMGWPGYNGGGTAPHATIKPIPGKGIEVREHIDFTEFAKALRNLSGGVETNRRGVVQFELIGTCDPTHSGDPSWYFWPAADDAVLEALAKYLKPILDRFAIPLKAPAFASYPESYGLNAAQRMHGDVWTSFEGIVGHQHAPENDHGDPGAFPISRFIKILGGTVVSVPPSSPAPAPAVQTVWGIGDAGLAVQRIQRIVGANPDGVFGIKTEAAVKDWQRAHGLTVDGLWGPQCEAAYRASLNAKPAPAIPPFPGYSKPSRRVNGATRAFQQRLRDRGWRVDVDGVHGKETTAVLKAFQKEKRLTVDGIGGPQTWAALWTSPITR